MARGPLQSRRSSLRWRALPTQIRRDSCRSPCVLGSKRSVDLDLSPELLILVADELDRLLVRHDALVDAHRERLRQRLRIVNGHIDLELAAHLTTEALGELRLTAVRCTAHVAPSID